LKHYEKTGEIRGPKTSAFAKALRGDTSAIVLDVWMSRALGFPQRRFEIPGIHREACRRIRVVADVLGWNPCEVQAAIWTSVATLNDGEKWSTDDKRYYSAPQLDITGQLTFWDYSPEPGDDIPI
jgi:hypothetical protein